MATHRTTTPKRSILDRRLDALRESADQIGTVTAAAILARAEQETAAAHPIVAGAVLDGLTAEMFAHAREVAA